MSLMGNYTHSRAPLITIMAASQRKVVNMVQRHYLVWLWYRTTCDNIWLNVYYCELFSSRVSVRVRFSVWLESDYAHVLFFVCYCHTVTNSITKQHNFSTSDVLRLGS